MKLTIQSTFPCEARRLFAEVLQSRSLHYVTKPLIRFKAVEAPLPNTWKDGKYLVKMYLFNVIYLGKQWINIHVNGEEQELLDAGSGQLITKWHHLIRVQESAEQQTDYTDIIDIEASWLTPFVVAFAYIFYHYRQRRWRRLIHHQFDYKQ